MRFTLTPRCGVGNEYVNRLRSHGRRTGPKPGFTHDDVVTAALENFNRVHRGIAGAARPQGRLGGGFLDRAIGSIIEGMAQRVGG